MTSYLVSCPDCGHRFPVERDTMRTARVRPWWDVPKQNNPVVSLRYRTDDALHAADDPEPAA